MKAIFACVLLVCAFLTPAAAEEPKSIGYGERPKLDAFADKGHGLGNPSYEQLVAALGKPKKETAGAMGGTPDRTLEYDGLTVIFEGQAFAEVTVTSTARKVMFGLGVGTSAKKVAATLGEPSLRTPEKLLYVDEFDAGVNKVEFTLKNGKVVAIKWDPYWD
jgi:hypothetical protein